MPATLTVVGLGPAGPEHLSPAARAALAGATAGYLRTSRHPAAAEFAGLASFDHVYEQEPTFAQVYARIVEELVAAAAHQAAAGGTVVYAVPGSPSVAEETVERLRADGRVAVTVVPALSFLDLAWDRLGVDPLAVGARVIDGTRFAQAAAGQPGPLLVGQCWSPLVLSEIKLALDPAGPGRPVTLLHHLGLADERVVTVAWSELDRTLVPDHLTSVWIPALDQPLATALVALDALSHTLRQQCPWDRQQTHASLKRHLLEEAYEVLEAIDGLSGLADDGPPAAEAAAVAHLCEELGDLLFQVVFHATLADEEAAFTLAEVATGIHDKLVLRHPHVFGEVTADSAEAVAENWEAIKAAEKGRTSVTQGIPSALPALVLAAKLVRKAPAAGLPLDSFAQVRQSLLDGLGALQPPAGDPAVEPATATADRVAADQLGALLFGLADLARRLGVDPEDALRTAALAFRGRLIEAERAG